MTTLFAQILPMFTGQTERAATEALRHILQQSAPARNALENMLRAAGVATGSLTQFRTEIGGDEGERVDLVCADKNGTERVLIEAKFWAGLTDNQPNTYLARLPQEGNSVLLFVAPAQRMETIWPELCARAREAHQLTIASESGDLRSAAIDGSERKMMATSWRAILEQLESRATIAGDAAVVTDIRQLRGLTDRMDTGAFLPVHSDELGQEFPIRILNWVRLVNDATERIIASGLAANSRSRASSRWHGYGRRFALGDLPLWFGIDFELWALNGQSPLWLQTLDGKDFAAIYIPTGVEYSDVLESVVRQLTAIGQDPPQENNEND